MQPQIALRDIILAMTSSSLSTPSRGVFRALTFATCADFGLFQAAPRAALTRGVHCDVGGINSSDVFYDERPDLIEQMIRNGILGVGMDAAEQCTLAARRGRRALAVLTVSDYLITHDVLPANDRERSIGDMVQIAPEAAFGSREVPDGTRCDLLPDRLWRSVDRRKQGVAKQAS